MTPPMKRLIPYVRIARPDHWFKNIFMLPGMALAYFIARSIPPAADIALGVLAACLAASANYTINEYLDAPFDRQHPTKRNRPAALGLVSLAGVVTQYLVLSIAALSAGFAVNSVFGKITLLFLAMGFLYNVPPFRTKDIAWLDVISESANNPIRFLLGWAIFLPGTLPPCSFILAFWFGGAYLMTLKRYAEVKKLGNASVIAAYRKSLAGYSASRLLSVAVFYAMNTALFLGISLIKYKVELILIFPLLAVLFSWYFAISLHEDSVVQTPEKLYREKLFIVFVGALAIIFSLICCIHVPTFEFFLEPVQTGV